MKAFAKNNTQSGSPNALVRKNGADSFFGVQAKLSIGKQGDKYEREADSVADKVVAKSDTQHNFFGKGQFFPASPNHNIQRSPFEEVQEKGEQEEIQEKSIAETIRPGVQLSTDDEEIQEKCAECEAEEKVQKVPFEDASAKENEPVQQQTEEEPIQEKCDDCGGEEQSIQKAGVEFPEIPEAEKEEDTVEAVKEEQQAEEVPAEEEAKGEEAAGGEEGPKALSMPTPQKDEEKKDKPKLQQKSSKNGSSNSSEIESSLQQSRGSGSKMAPGVMQEMNQSFGTNFENVNIHTGSNAVQMNKDLGAHAFTSGSDIYFNQGKYDPESKEGKHLLAHELTHTIQQGATSNKIQRFAPPGKTVTPESGGEKPNDGAAVEGKSNNKINNDDKVKDGADLSDEEKKEKKDPPRGEVHQEKGAVQSEGVSTPPVDRGAEASEKIADQKAQMNEQLSQDAGGGEGEGGTEGAEAKNSNMAEADAAEAGATAALQKANAIPIPAKPEPFKHPNVVAPVDSAGQPLPRKGNIDTQVRGLGYIAEMLREKGYEMKKHGAEKEIHAAGLDGSLETSRMDLALAKEGTQKTEDQNTERKDISEKSKKALDESKQRQQFVATEAPGLAQEADSGSSESGALSSDAGAKANQSKSEIPDDPDAKADAEKQSGEMDQTSQGAQSMDEAITKTGERARTYIQDAEQASKDNQQSETGISETDATITQIDSQVAIMKGKNEASQASITNSAGGPDIIRQHAKETAETGDQLIAATIVMEAELNSLQDEYVAGMKAIESKEAAEERVKKEQEEKQQQEASPQDLELFAMAAMPEAELEEHIKNKKPEEKEGLMAALDKMIAQTPDDGTEATEGKRFEVKLSSGEGGPTDPRQPQIDEVDNQRITRLGGVMSIADQNMSHLTVAQQKILAQKLVGESITDDIKNISVQQMAKGMIEGMINPMASLEGVVGGFEKTFSGVANIFNADAWAKDPLGNLLQIGADISTGLAMVFSSILGIAGMITALMVALTIISWGTLSPITGPVIGWMGTVMTYAGWGAIVAGVLSVYFNSLAYIKNLNDAGTAETATELFGNVEQMKKNASDGMTGAMAIVEGVGAVKMGPVMKSGAFMKNVPKSPGAFARQTLDGAKEGLEAVAKMPGRVAAGAKKLFAGGKKGLSNFKKKIQGFFSKSSKGDIDLPNNSKKQKDLLGESKNKKMEDMTPEQRRADLDETANNPPKEIDADSPYHKTHDIEIESNGHTYRRRRDGNGWCRFTTPECGIPEADLPASVQNNIPKKTKKHKDFDAEVQRRLDNGEIDADTAKKLREYNDSTKSGATRDMDGVIEDIEAGKVLDPETSRFGKDKSDAPQGNPALKERATQRKETRAQIKNKQIEAGHYVEIDGVIHLKDPNTGKVLPNYPENYPDFYPEGHKKAGQPHPKAGEAHPKAGEPMGDIGHKPGHEWKNYQQDVKNKDKTRQQVIEDQNVADNFFYEDPSSNRSHKFEKKD